MSVKPWVLPVAVCAAFVVGAGLLVVNRSVTPAPRPLSPPPVNHVQVEQVPEIEFRLPTRHAKSKVIEPADENVILVREVLLTVVKRHALDPTDPWAIGHALLALGPDTKLPDGRPAIPFLFKEYGLRHTVGGEHLIGFPRKRGNIRIEPHTDLTLKVLSELQVPLDTEVEVQGESIPISKLYLNSLHKAWISAGGMSFDSMNDTPWALQGFATYAPAGLSWTAVGEHPMSLDMFTDVAVADLHKKTAFMREAMEKGEAIQKRRQGIWAYTCGGTHLLQGTAYAVARGFGSVESRARVEEQVPILFWRLHRELEIYDTLMKEQPAYTMILLEQRLKFLGHFLETTHKWSALEIFQPTEEQASEMKRARVELVRTVGTIQQIGIFEDLPKYKENGNTYQQYLDFVGDSAHAIRGLDMSTGDASIAY